MSRKTRILLLVSVVVASLVDANFEDDNLDIEWRLGITVPGTKWCGPGNNAEDIDHLGEHKEEDKCCRAHDLCDHIPVGETRYGLWNFFGPFAKMECDCEVKFKQCLKQVNTKLADRIGNAYFTAQNRCYKNEHPILWCNEIQVKIVLLMPLTRCIDYKVNYERAKTYQWFDLPFYE